MRKLLNNKYPFISFHQPNNTESEMHQKSSAFYELMNSRRSVREFSTKKVSLQLIDQLILTASTSPSGAHKQPWTFCVVTNPEIKQRIKDAAETEEKKSYTARMPDVWLQDLAPLGTTWQKEFLIDAPVLIIVFKRNYERINDEIRNNYYTTESVGIAVGILLAAIQNSGLVALTHTPSPMNFLKKILNRPENEKPFLLIPIGYAKENTFVPELKRKSIDEIRILF